MSEIVVKTEIGKEIRRLREQVGLSIRGLERKSGVSGATISRIETGSRKKPTVEVLRKLSMGLGINELHLLTYGSPNREVKIDAEMEIMALETNEKKFVEKFREHEYFFEELNADLNSVENLHRLWNVMKKNESFFEVLLQASEKDLKKLHQLWKAFKE